MVLPGLINWLLVPLTVPLDALVVRVKPELLMALAISPAVINLPASAAAGVFTLPAVVVSVVVLAFILPFASLVMVVPSVFTDKS